MLASSCIRSGLAHDELMPIVQLNTSQIIICTGNKAKRKRVKTSEREREKNATNNKNQLNR